MTKKFTLNDLFLYHYNELDSSERSLMEELIASDVVFQAESIKILEMKNFLNTEQKEPSVASIHYILEHNRKSSNEMAY